MEQESLTKEIRDLIIYGLNENNIDVNRVDFKKIDLVVEDYLSYCREFKLKLNYDKQELGTFEKAACLLVAINKNELVFDKRLNASVAIDVAEKMCEKPYWYIGLKSNIPYKMEEVDFKSLFVSNKHFYNNHRSKLTDVLIHESGVSPIVICLNLKSFYLVARKLKKDQLKATIDNMNRIPDYSREENNVEHSNNPDAPTIKRKLF